MSRKTYPLISRSEHRPKNTAAKCPCGNLATHRVTIAASYMRGEDDVVWRCQEHIGAIQVPSRETTVSEQKEVPVLTAEDALRMERLGWWTNEEEQKLLALIDSRTVCVPVITREQFGALFDEACDEYPPYADDLQSWKAIAFSALAKLSPRLVRE